MGKSPLPIAEFLSNLPLFGTLDRAAIARIAAGTKQVDAPRRTTIFRCGECCTGMHIIVFGQVKLSLETNGGDEKVVALIDAGMSCGEAAMFLNKPYLTTAEAIVDSKLVHVDKDALLGEVRRSGDFSQSVIENLSRRLYQRIDELETFTLASGTQRVIRYLLNHQPEAALNGALHLTLPAKKWVIASRLNLTREHFSRILHDLARNDLIQVEGRVVCVPDLKRLRAVAAH